jgi:hypothetical protein
MTIATFLGVVVAAMLVFVFFFREAEFSQP